VQKSAVEFRSQISTSGCTILSATSCENEMDAAVKIPVSSFSFLYIGGFPPL
jgi:hypothetical protein